jgi:hypothetical protein
MEVVVAALFVVLFVGWLIAELKGGRTARVSIGILCMVMLLGVMYCTSLRDALLEAQYDACFRLLEDALEKHDYERATAAVKKYNQPDPSKHRTFQLEDVLTGKM